MDDIPRHIRNVSAFTMQQGTCHISKSDIVSKHLANYSFQQFQPLRAIKTSFTCPCIKSHGSTHPPLPAILPPSIRSSGSKSTSTPRDIDVSVREACLTIPRMAALQT